MQPWRPEIPRTRRGRVKRRNVAKTFSLYNCPWHTLYCKSDQYSIGFVYIKKMGNYMKVGNIIDWLQQGMSCFATKPSKILHRWLVLSSRVRDSCYGYRFIVRNSVEARHKHIPSWDSNSQQLFQEVIFPALFRSNTKWIRMTGQQGMRICIEIPIVMEFSETPSDFDCFSSL